MRNITNKIILISVLCCIVFQTGCTININLNSNGGKGNTVSADNASSILKDDQMVTVSDRKVIHEEEFGGIYIDLSIEEFSALGFDYGDEVSIYFSNGYKLENIPYYNGYYAKTGQPLLVGYPSYPYITAALKDGDPLWTVADMKEGDTADISLINKGKYLDIQNASDIHYSNDRTLYSSDEAFANFRSVNSGNISKNILYRSASPCDNRFNRAKYVDRLMQEANVRFILDLADDNEKLQNYISGDDFDSPYFLSLYDEGYVIPIALDTDFASATFRGKLAYGLRTMTAHEGPYLVHCTEGKDRTGFVCMLLEALCGADYDELLDDYMITYENYYGITKESDPNKYEIIVSEDFLPRLQFITGDNTDSAKADLCNCAEEYLKSAGLTDSEIIEIKRKLINFSDTL